MIWKGYKYWSGVHFLLHPVLPTSSSCLDAPLWRFECDKPGVPKFSIEIPYYLWETFKQRLPLTIWGKVISIACSQKYVLDWNVYYIIKSIAIWPPENMSDLKVTVSMIKVAICHENFELATALSHYNLTNYFHIFHNTILKQNCLFRCLAGIGQKNAAPSGHLKNMTLNIAIKCNIGISNKKTKKL